MAFRIRHIASRFLLQSIFTVLIISSLLVIFIYSGNKKKDTLNALTFSHSNENKIKELFSSIDRILFYQRTDPEFVSKTADQNINNAIRLAEEIRDSLSVFRNYNFLQNLLKNNNYIDTISVHLKFWSVNLEKYGLSFKELGNSSGGTIAYTINEIDTLSRFLSVAPDNKKQYSKLKIIDSKLLTSYSLESINELTIFCENLSSEYLEYPDFDFFTLEQITQPLLNRLNSCKNILERIYGNEIDKGQYNKLMDISETLKKSGNQFSEDILNETSKYNVWWNLAFIFAAIVLMIAYLVIMTTFSQRVQRNIKQTANNSQKISVGNLEKISFRHNAYEFLKINTNLKNTQKYLSECNSFVFSMLNNNFQDFLKTKGQNDKFTENLNALQERMIKEQEVQKKRDEENETRRYTNEGLAKFADIMRLNSNDTAALGDNLLKELVKYIGFIQGGIFLTNEENENELNLVSAFAYSRKKYIQKALKKGQGLVGTCALEKKTINLTEVPEDYIFIRSGLGDTPPNNVLIVPVMHENQLVGVLELAGLKVLNEYEIHLTEQIASNLAATVITVRTNTTTAQLLEKSQQQAAEMREQEEEMRQNMEELKATQEESSRREEEMQGLLDAVNTSFYLIEYSTDGLIENMNSRLTSFLEQPFETVVGSKHREVFSDNSGINDELLSDIVNNKIIKKLEETLSWGSKELVYKHTLSPILSKNGDVLKVLNLLTIEDKLVE